MANTCEHCGATHWWDADWWKGLLILGRFAKTVIKGSMFFATIFELHDGKLEHAQVTLLFLIYLTVSDSAQKGDPKDE